MNSPEPVCGLDVALAVMGGKWKPLILYHLQGGPRRFGELKRRVVGISEKVLIQQLRELAAAGVLTRRDHRRVPPMVDYTMTPFGLTLISALMPLCEWGNQHRADVERILDSTSLDPTRTDAPPSSHGQHQAPVGQDRLAGDEARGVGA